jgi:hypothetical protein
VVEAFRYKEVRSSLSDLWQAGSEMKAIKEEKFTVDGDSIASRA